jgi:CBS domain-containing protein
MQGIELSRTFFAEVVRPWLREVAPGLPYSAALVGYGSELLGFDDELSKDHNWGPRIHIFLNRRDFNSYAHQLVEGFRTAAPANYLGEPIGWRSRPHPPSADEEAVGAYEHGLEVHTVEATLERILGVRSVSLLNGLQWLGFPEQRLLAFTAGAVFHDHPGHLTMAREILAYFPNDVWHYKIACQWRRIGEEQAFVGRAGQVGDELGSRVIAGRLVRDAMRMGFLLERRYAPYAKWFGTAFTRLPISESLSPHLHRALLATEWTERGDALAMAYLELARTQGKLGIAPFDPIVGPYYERPFTTINTDDAVSAALEKIEDEQIKALPVIGSIDQVSDLTPVLENPVLSQNLVHQLA